MTLNKSNYSRTSIIRIPWGKASKKFGKEKVQIKRNRMRHENYTFVYNYRLITLFNASTIEYS